METVIIVQFWTYELCVKNILICINLPNKVLEIKIVQADIEERDRSQSNRIESVETNLPKHGNLSYDRVVIVNHQKG